MFRLGLGRRIGLRSSLLFVFAIGLRYIMRQRERHRDLQQSGQSCLHEESGSPEYLEPEISGHTYAELDAASFEMFAG